MLQNSFLHISGIGQKTEQSIWQSGLHSWHDCHPPFPTNLSKTIIRRIQDGLDNHPDTILDSPEYLYKTLPTSQHWRLFPRFRDSTAFLDIETTGTHQECQITTIALYDGVQILTFSNGHNLHTFPEVLEKYNVIVTYNGKCFDVPIIEHFFNIKVNQAHIDLRSILAQIGLKGGLKGCEKLLGIDRQELSGVDGYGAVLLWKEYQRCQRSDVLETLLAYNIADAVNLEPLLIHAYNRNLQDTPFYKEKQIAPATPP
ncbi:MAG: ribonuclease H-like domain-containing protein, partial [Spirochaetales bacterium]|nr:ribonuclease H-like domain-containing protein [Spirochaetales bacterium]